jgi:hypothetical protein
MLRSVEPVPTTRAAKPQRRNRGRARAAVRCAVGGLLAILLASPAAAQSGSARDALWSLLLLPGKQVSVRYTPGSLDRASRLQQRLEPLAKELGSWSGQAAPLAIFLLSREEWEQVGIALPYGFPARLPGRLLTLAAWGDDGTLDLWQGLLHEQLPEAESGFAAGSPTTQASLEVCDLLGSVEAARILLEKAGVSGEELWISELMAHTAYLAVRWQGPPRAGGDEDVRSATAVRPSGALPLAAYEAGLSMEDWLWFQSAFYRGARQLIERRGHKVGRLLLRTAAKNGGTLRRAELIDHYPEVGEWLRTAFAP